MKSLFSIILSLFLTLIITVTTYAATDSELLKFGSQNQGFSGQQLSGTNQQFPSIDQQQPGNLSDEAILRLLENKRDSKDISDDDLSENEIKSSEKRDELKDVRKSKSKKSQLIVKAEAGDGLAKLSWKLIETAKRKDEQPLRFIIRYGIESERLLKSIQVGKSDGYVLRELKKLSAIFHTDSCT